MHLIWKRKKALVSDLLADFPSEKKPPHSTISSVVRILESKGFVGHKAYGRTHEYFPLISKVAYKKFAFKKMMQDYFDNSYEEVVSFMVKEEALSEAELAEIRHIIEEGKES